MAFYTLYMNLLGSLSNFNEEFNRVIQLNTIKNKKVILSGDFNINILKIAEKPAYAKFFDMLTANSLLPNTNVLHILQELQEHLPLLLTTFTQTALGK